MIKGLAGNNYKNGKYVFGMFNIRDFAIMISLAAGSCLFGLFILPNFDLTDDVLWSVIRLLVIINVIVIVTVLPIPHYQAVYIFVYYQIKHILVTRKYYWKGIEYDFKEEEHQDSES